MTKKKRKTITLAELSQRVYEEEQRKKNPKPEDIDQMREHRMEKKRAKSVDGTLRARIHPSRNGRKARLTWDTLNGGE